MASYAMTLLLLALAGKWLLMGYAYYMGVAIATMIAVHHYFLIKTREKTNCFKAFLQNTWFGFAIFAGLGGHYLIQYFR